jgi:hypothetical protein
MRARQLSSDSHDSKEFGPTISHARNLSQPHTDGDRGTDGVGNHYDETQSLLRAPTVDAPLAFDGIQHHDICDDSPKMHGWRRWLPAVSVSSTAVTPELVAIALGAHKLLSKSETLPELRTFVQQCWGIVATI